MKNKEESDFIIFAYEKKKVKDITDAFDEYPPEEEWHKGKIENVLNEPEAIYNHYNVNEKFSIKIN